MLCGLRRVIGEIEHAYPGPTAGSQRQQVQALRELKSQADAVESRILTSSYPSLCQPSFASDIPILKRTLCVSIKSESKEALLFWKAMGLMPCSDEDVDEKQLLNLIVDLTLHLT